MEGFEYIHDTTGSPVQVRVRIREPARIRRTINLSASVNSTMARVTTGHFENHFPESNVRVVDFLQQDPWEQNVRIAARVDFAGMNTQNLHFYSYNRETNKYKPVNTGYGIDANGYVHFSSELAGSIVIADKSLTGRENYFPGPPPGGEVIETVRNTQTASYDAGMFHPDTGGGFDWISAFPTTRPVLDIFGRQPTTEAKRVGLIVFAGFIALAVILPMLDYAYSTRKRKDKPQPAFAGVQTPPMPPATVPRQRTVTAAAGPPTAQRAMPPSRNVVNVLEQALAQTRASTIKQHKD
jgi:hypothetical protein